jgi:hypothetical protein
MPEVLASLLISSHEDEEVLSVNRTRSGEGIRGVGTSSRSGLDFAAATGDMIPEPGYCGTVTSFQPLRERSGVGERFGALAATSSRLSSTRLLL